MSQSREGNFTGVAGPRRRFEAALRGARIAGPTGVDWEYYSSHRDVPGADINGTVPRRRSANKRARVPDALTSLALCTSLQPFERLRPLSTRKHPDVRMGKVLGYRGSNLQEGAVRNGGDAVNVAMVIVHKPEMFKERAEAVPSRKGPRFNQQSG